MFRFIVLFSCYFVFCAGYKEVCGPNEEMRCVQSCPPQKTCRNRDIQFSCLQVVEPCQSKCVCKAGFLRNAVGDCITGAQCDMCPGKNEYFACGSACDNVCATLETENKTNCPIINIVCNRKCYCEDGYARDDKENCIPVEKCHDHDIKGISLDPPKNGGRVRRHSDITEQSCGENEVYTDCKKSCPPDTCLAIVARFKCDASEPCKKGCVCKSGFYRREPDSPCVPICQCDEVKYSPDCKHHE